MRVARPSTRLSRSGQNGRNAAMGDITTIWDGRAGFSDRFPSDRLSRWIVQLRDRVGWQKAAVALANKHARILWSMLVNGQSFDPEHVPTKHQMLAMAAKPTMAG